MGRRNPKAGSRARGSGVKGDMPQPLSVREQWEEVERCYQFLATAEQDDQGVFADFNSAWEEMSENGYPIGGKPTVQRGANCRAADTPLASLFFYVEMGMYPPPELLMALEEAWRRYLDASGFLTLDEAFLGPNRKAVGNYAAIRARRFRLMVLRWDFDKMIHAGMAPIDAAEKISDQLGGKPDADSVLRMMRRFKVALKKFDADK